MKLYTRTGDDGETGLIGGRRVSKDDLRVTCYGQVDELNAAVGLAVASCSHADWIETLRSVQSDLFILGAQLATEEGRQPAHAIGAERVTRLEPVMDAVMAELRPLKNFVLPGGCELAARFHMARTVCRRAERDVVSLVRNGGADKQAVAYLNRLGDLLFAYALAANRRAGVADILWIAP
jgi:cob(I)alamin adenosyltransferase